MEKSMEKKKWRFKNINPADPHTSISHILMSHEQLPSYSIPTFHCHYRSKNFGRTLQLNSNIYMDKSLICTIVEFRLLALDSL